MAQTAPSPDKTSNQTTSGNLTPPDEQFWQHYSPHGEFPLSSVGSLVLHLLVFGLIALVAWLGVALFSHSSKSLPVDVVRLGGGGGNPRGSGDDPNRGPAPVEVGSQRNDTAVEKSQTTDVPPPEIKPNIEVKDKPKFEDPSTRRINLDAKASSTFEGLRQTATRIQPPQAQGSEASGYGKGGTGKGGGSGAGEGPGTGDGRGPGTAANLTKREKRNIRWTLHFNTVDHADYVSQLQGLGAVLAIPDAERGENDFEYVIVRNLSARPAKVSREKIEDVLREVSGMVRWLDDKPQDAAGIIAALGLPMPKIDPRKLHFFACMPARTEEKLLQLELAYLHKKHPNLGEDDIYSTKFQLTVRGGKYEPRVSEQKLKKDARE